eukprot:COSAG01_NODE_26365_length_716_cov_1.047002_1_plen_153_part_01
MLRITSLPEHREKEREGLPEGRHPDLPEGRHPDGVIDLTEAGGEAQPQVQPDELPPMPTTPPGRSRRRSSIERSLHQQANYMALTRQVQDFRKDRRRREKARRHKQLEQDRAAEERAAAGMAKVEAEAAPAPAPGPAPAPTPAPPQFQAGRPP